MKKAVTVILSVLLAVFAGAVFGIAMHGLERNDSRGLIPFEKISGIKTKATLKPGCKVINGYHFPFDDNGIRCHCIRVGMDIDVNSSEVTYTGLSVRDISIIDVYGDKCTITFICSDDNERYAEYDYPLVNLNYNKAKVDAANDGIKTEFIGSRYTL